MTNVGETCATKPRLLKSSVCRNLSTIICQSQQQPAVTEENYLESAVIQHGARVVRAGRDMLHGASGAEVHVPQRTTHGGRLATPSDEVSITQLAVRVPPPALDKSTEETFGVRDETRDGDQG